MEGRGNLESFASFRVPGLRRSRGRIRHIDHIPKCQFRRRAAKDPTRNNVSFVAWEQTPSCPVRFQCAEWIPVRQERGRRRRSARPVWGDDQRTPSGGGSLEVCIEPPFNFPGLDTRLGYLAGHYRKSNFLVLTTQPIGDVYSKYSVADALTERGRMFWFALLLQGVRKYSGALVIHGVIRGE
jgi:hypothetical protein